MTKLAQNYQKFAPSTVDGLEDIFDVVPTDADINTTDADSGKWFTTAEAVSRLKKSERTIQRYAKAGKLQSKFNLDGKLMVFVATDADIETTSADTEIRLTAPADNLPTPADSTNSDSQKHLDLIRELQTKLESLTYRNGYLESKLEEKESQIQLLTDSLYKPSRWVRFTKWFLGQ